MRPEESTIVRAHCPRCGSGDTGAFYKMDRGDWKHHGEAMHDLSDLGKPRYQRVQLNEGDKAQDTPPQYFYCRNAECGYVWDAMQLLDPTKQGEIRRTRGE